MDLLKTMIYKLNQASSIDTRYQLLEYVRTTKDGPIEAKMLIGSEAELYKHIAARGLGIQLGDVYSHELVKQNIVSYLEHMEYNFKNATYLNDDEVDCYYVFDKMPGSQMAWNHPDSDYEFVDAYYKFKNLEPNIVLANLESLKQVHCELKIDLSTYFTDAVNTMENKNLRQLELI